MLAQGDLEAASGWAQNSGLSLEAPPTYMMAWISEILTLARARIAQSQSGTGEASVDWVLRFLIEQTDQAEAHGRMWDLIQILVLEAMARQAQGDLWGSCRRQNGR